MNVFEWALVVLGSMTLIAIILYAVSYEETIITSTVSSEGGEMDQYYYLPHAHLTLRATATVMVEKSPNSKKIIGHKVLQISFEPAVHIGPDPESRVSVAYKGNWFTNDEFQVSTSTAGLLENVKVVSEDRLPNIIAQVTQAQHEMTKGLTTTSFVAEALTDEPAIVEVIQETRSFTITAKELEGALITKNWLIPIKGDHDGTAHTADATFTLQNSKTFTRKATKDISYKGLLTRPLVEQTWTLKNADLDAVSFTCLVPDTSALIKVPVKRSRFVKRAHLPKFSNGLLVENTITKPSEFEGMISIPLNILKAIVSIPAQLFQFKISQVKQNTEYEKALAELAKVRKESFAKQSSELRKISGDIEALKKIASEAGAAVTTEGKIPKLGKLPPLEEDFDEETARFKKSVVEDALDARELAVRTLPAIEASLSWAEKNDIWDHYDNFDFKTCVPASGAYLLTSWSSNAHPPAIILTRKVVMDTLRKVAPNGDIEEGCRVRDFLRYWQDTGIEGDRINMHRSLKKRDPELLKHAIYWFGGCMVGLQLPVSMKTSDRWIFNESLKNESPEGHAVCAIGYSNDVFTVISFGKVIQMDAAFYKEFNDETYMVLSQKHWTASERNQAPTRPPATFEKLQEIMQGLYADGTYSI
jgi:hypothetical protein